MAYYDKLKNKIRHQEPLPDGYDFDSMKEGIYSKMPAKEEERRRQFLVWWFIPILGLLTGLTYFISKESESVPNTKVSTAQVKVQNSSSVVERMVQKVNVSKLHDQGQVVDNTTSSIKESDANIKDNDFNKILQSRSHKKESSIFENLGKSAPRTYRNFKELNNEKNAYKKTIVKNTQNVNEIHHNETTQGTKSGDLNALHEDSSSIMKDLTSIPKLDVPMTINTLPNKFIVPVFKKELINITHDINSKPFKIKQSKIWSLESGVGFFAWKSKNFNNGDFQPNANQIIAKTTPNFGYNAFVYGELLLENGWYFSAGLDAMIRKSYLTYVSISTKQIDLENQIVKIEQNLLTGTENQVIGKANAMVSESHRLQKNNTDFVLKVPIIGGYSLDYEKWSLNAGIGLSANIWSQHKGVTISNGNLMTYNGAHPLWNPILQINFESQLKLKYHINHNIYIGSLIQYSKAMNKQLLTERDIIKPTYLGVSGMFGYSF